jgi:hypothetical protein
MSPILLAWYCVNHFEDPAGGGELTSIPTIAEPEENIML